MAPRKYAIDRAFGRIDFLIQLVQLERKRAEGRPLDDRWVDFGIVKRGVNKKHAEQELYEFFDEIQYLLEHLAIMDLASTFEMEATKHIQTFVGEARKVVRQNSEDKMHWRENIIKDDLRGLDGIFKLLSLDKADAVLARTIKEARNNYSHGVELKNVPKITSETTRAFLKRWLGMLP